MSGDAFNDSLVSGTGGLIVGDVSVPGDVFATNVTGSFGNDTVTSGGNSDSDRIIGTMGPDTLAGDAQVVSTVANTATIEFSVSNPGDNNNAHAFNDTIKGEAGNDLIAGDVAMVGPGAHAVEFSVGDNGNGQFSLFNDTLSGGAGDDTVVGDVFLDGGHIDVALYGGSGADTMFCDSIQGGAGNDLLIGDFNDNGSVTVTFTGDTTGFKLFADTISGGGGDDTIFGGLGDDSLSGDGGDDSISGGDGNDTISGGGGRDLLDGGTGNDLLSGGGSRDAFQFSLHDSNGSGPNDGSDHITDWNTKTDALKFTDVVDQHGGSTAPADLLDDLAQAISGIQDNGTDTTIDFKNGASIQFDGVHGVVANADATTAADIGQDLQNLVDGHAAQLQIATG